MNTTTPTISVIMPTLNSAKTIDISLKSIRNQRYDQKFIEIVVADGGSTDITLEIASNYSCHIVENERVLPEHGKLVGLNNSKGKYCVFMDSDEELVDRDSFAKRVALFIENATVHNIAAAGLRKPQGYNYLAEYINSYGDPFSNYIYNLDGSDYYREFIDKYSIVEKYKDYIVVRPSSREIIPIVDGGTHMFDREYFLGCENRKIFMEHDIPLIFTEMVHSCGRFGVIKNDYVNHYSTTTLDSYLKKLRYRVHSNALNKKENLVGYSNRESYLPQAIRKKKYIYPLWVITFLPLLSRSLQMVYKKNNIAFLINIFLAYYTLIVIFSSYVRGFLGRGIKLHSYGQN